METLNFTIDRGQMYRPQFGAIYKEVLTKLNQTPVRMPHKDEIKFMNMECRLGMKACKRASCTIQGVRIVITKLN